MTRSAPPAPAILYLHGFISSPRSAKARLLADYLGAHHPDWRCRIPALPEEPAGAFAAAEAALREELGAGAAPIGLVGSSMGGFYATVLAGRYGLRAVVVNPAVRPERHLREHLGEHVNPYSGRRFTLDESHVAELEALAPAPPAGPDIWLLAQTGDEVLDYRDAVTFYAGCRQTVEPGGDHAFRGFERYLPDIIKFLQCAAE